MQFKKNFEKFLMPSVTAGEAFVALVFGIAAILVWIFSDIGNIDFKSDWENLILFFFQFGILLLLPLMAIYFLGSVFFGKRQMTKDISSTIYTISIPFISFIWASYLFLMIPKFSDPNFSFFALPFYEKIILFYAILVFIRLLLLFFLSSPLKIKPVPLSSSSTNPLVIIFALAVGSTIFFIGQNSLWLNFTKAFAVSSIVLYVFSVVSDNNIIRNLK
jgi:hypothetical protein